MNRKKLLYHLVSLLTLSCLLVLGIGSSDDEESDSDSSTSTIYVNASVRFDGTQFIIENKDSTDWVNVKLEINSETFSSGYILKQARMEAMTTYTVGAMQFSKSDGEKFNPFTHKTLNFSIWCETPEGKGFYYGAWD